MKCYLELSESQMPAKVYSSNYDDTQSDGMHG
jgi:hypothetical protein